MNTIELNPAIEFKTEATEKASKSRVSLTERYAAFAESHASNRTAWFLVSILGQGVLFLPVPAALLYYYNASIIVLVITMILFFANIIAGMGGSKIGSLIFLLALSIVVHVAMIMFYVL